MDRRAFLVRSSAMLATMMAAPSALAALVGTPVRVRGHVRSGRRGVAGVAVSDGLQIVRTDRSGKYVLVTSSRQPFVYITVPSGYRIPVSDTGTARFYARIQPREDQDIDFMLEREEDQDHAFVVLADIQTQNAFEMDRFRAETVPDVRGTVARLAEQPVFGVSCGDIMFDDLSLFPAYERAVGDMGIPFFQVVGNHDLDMHAAVDVASTDTFNRHFGPRYFAFDRGEVHYVVLDNVFWNSRTYFGYVDADQLAWLEADLAGVEQGKTVVVFAHIPTHGMGYARRGATSPGPGDAVANREALYALLAPYRAHIIQGHTHDMEHVFEGGVHSHVLGTACGAWWSGDICHDGTPNGYGVYQVRGSELTWYYKSTGRPSEHQMRLHAGSDGSVVANVWNWDPEWTVVWYSGADRRGVMERRTGLDPVSVREHTGPDLPPRRTWVEPEPTDHLFHTPETAGGPVTVEVTDRFGSVYSASL